MIYRLGVDALADIRVVLDLDVEITADRLHEHAILDGDMRVDAFAMLLAAGAFPLEFMLRRELHLMVGAVAGIAQHPVLHHPLERLEIIHPRADPELHVEVRTDGHELREDRVLVILVERFEIRLELLIPDQLQGHWHERAVLLELIDAEDIRDLHLRLEAEDHIVTEQETVLAQANKIARDTVVLRGDTLRRDERGGDGAEDLFACRVQLVQPRAQLRRLRVQAVTDDLIRAALQHDFVGLGCLWLWRFLSHDTCLD